MHLFDPDYYWFDLYAGHGLGYGNYALAVLAIDEYMAASSEHFFQQQMEPTYFIRSRGRITGPFEESVLRRMISRGQLTRVHELSPDGIQWALLTDYPQFVSTIGSIAPQGPGAITSNRPAAASPPPLGSISTNGVNQEFEAILKGTRGWFGRNQDLVRRGVLIGGSLAACFLIIMLGRWAWQSFSPKTTLSEEQLYSQLQASVGRVIVGFQGTVNKNYIESPYMTGTAFLVSSRGYYLTNRHVIEPHIPYHEDAARARRECSELSSELKVSFDLQSQIWLLIDNRKYRCELVGYSKHFDLAVLKAEVVPGATPLALSTKDSISPPAVVHAAGFPAVNDELLTREAKIKQTFKENISDIKTQFSRQALTLQVNSGTVNLTFAGDKEIQTIKHQAVVNPGNSGGPLLNTGGTVVGINTEVTRIQKGSTFEAASYAPIIAAMRQEIDRHIPGVNWQN